MDPLLPKVAAEGRVIRSFVFQHLLSAVIFARKVNSIEDENLGKSFGDFFTEIRSYASASLMASAAAIDANINELYVSHGSVLRQKIENFEKRFWGKYGIESKPVLKKYTKALNILEKIPTLKAYKNSRMLTYCLL